MTKQQLTILLGALILASSSSTELLAAETREQICATYAITAMSQYEMNINMKCNYTGLRWSDIHSGHKKWCLTVRPSIFQSETSARKQLLNTCYERKVSSGNTPNKAQVPGACRWNKAMYTPVTYLLTRQNYNLESSATAPISGGQINKDFNGDGKLDYLFMERSPSDTPQRHFRSVLCMSSPSGWKRTKFYDLKEDISQYSSVEIQSIYPVKNGFTYSEGTSEHNLGSRFSSWTYSYYKQHKGFLLNTYKSETSTGDGYMADTTDVFDYIKGEIRNTVDCNSMAPEARGGCISKNNVVSPMKKTDNTVSNRRLKTTQ